MIKVSPITIVQKDGTEKRRVKGVQPTNMQQLHDAIKSTWTKISEEYFQHIFESVPWRIKAALKEKASPTQY